MPRLGSSDRRRHADRKYVASGDPSVILTAYTLSLQVTTDGGVGRQTNTGTLAT